jgi:thymidylate kinase
MFTEGVYTVTNICLQKHSDDELIIHDPVILHGNTLYESNGRYGFRVSELRKIIKCDNFVLLSQRNKDLVVMTNDEFAKMHHDVPYFTIGICAGRPLRSSLKYLNGMGFHPIVPVISRDMHYGSNDYMVISGKTYYVKYVIVKSADITNVLDLKFIDAIMCYSDVWYSLDVPNYNIKYIGNFVDELGEGETYISLVSQKGFVKPTDRKIKIASEYNDGNRLLLNISKSIGLDLNNCEFIKVSGSVESYLLSGAVDYAITIVQSGHTLVANDLELVSKLKRVYLNMWIHLDPFDRKNNDKYYGFYLALKDPKKINYLIFDGIDGAGKSSIIKELQKNNIVHNWVCYDRHHLLSKATLKPIKNWETSEDIVVNSLRHATKDNTKIIIVESDVDKCWDRISTRKDVTLYEHPDALSYFRFRYRELASMYGYHLVDNNESLEIAVNKVIDIVKNNSNEYKLPSLLFDSFDGKIHVQGESKIVREYNWRFDIIQYKPSVYSHKAQRGGTILGTDVERQQTTRNLLYLLALNRVNHTYWCVYNGNILAERIRNPPPVEVCVKRFHVGTHKHIYHRMLETPTRTGESLVDGAGMYKEPIVRFDWRNPNHLNVTGSAKLMDLSHAQIFVNPLRAAGKTSDEITEILENMFPHGIPLGDYAMAEDLADKYIDVSNAKTLVKKAFEVLEFHFKNMGIQFKDVCFMPTMDGTKLYGETSQDCGRYELVGIDKLEPLDKDVWRSGGSSELVLEKWRRLSVIVEEYVNGYFEKWNKHVGLL